MRKWFARVWLSAFWGAGAVGIVLQLTPWTDGVRFFRAVSDGALNLPFEVLIMFLSEEGFRLVAALIGTLILVDWLDD